MTRLYENSRAASSQGPKDDVMITEVTNGLIVTRLYENSRASLFTRTKRRCYDNGSNKRTYSY